MLKSPLTSVLSEYCITIQLGKHSFIEEYQFLEFTLFLEPIDYVTPATVKVQNYLQAKAKS